MAKLDVEKKKNDDLWKWVVGILAAIIIIWVIVEATGTDDTMDDMDDVDDMETTTGNQTSLIIQPDTYYHIS